MRSQGPRVGRPALRFVVGESESLLVLVSPHRLVRDHDPRCCATPRAHERRAEWHVNECLQLRTSKVEYVVLEDSQQQATPLAGILRAEQGSTPVTVGAWLV